mgnify:FL=1
MCAFTVWLPRPKQYRPAVCRAALLALVLLGLALSERARAQAVCPGDVDGNGQVTATDGDALLSLLFPENGELPFPWNGDANVDASLSAADLVGLTLRLGTSCASPTPTRSATPTPTPTLRSSPTPSSPTATSTTTATFTRTFTPSFTPTPTPTCVVRTISAGQSVDETLTASDCPRFVAGTLRMVDAYELQGPAGSALRVSVTGSAGLSNPWIAVIDSNGQFTFGHGAPPVEWVAVPGKPYLVYVTSDPNQPQQTGSYRITVSTRPCPTPRTIRLSTGFAASSLTLSNNDCPDPAAFSSGGSSDPVHAYTFDVTTVPTQINIVMRQLIEDDPLDPSFVVVGPDGVEVVPADQVDDAGGGPLGTDAAGRFLVTVPGTYTMYAGGGTGRYSLVVTAPSCTVRPLSNIPADRPLVCSGQSGPGCQGTLSGNRSLGTCAAPLPAFTLEEVPAVNAGADLYSFAAQAGDIVSVALEVDGDEGYALLLGPSSAGNPRVAYASSFLTADSTTQLGATVTKSGTYLLSLGNVSALAAPDSSIGDPGDQFAYRFFLQKCPPAGVLTSDAASPVQSNFRVSDCLGDGLVPMRNYSLAGRAGQLVSVQMVGDDSIDPYLRLWAPDESKAENDNDVFDASGKVARVWRILPADGTYFVEASTSPLAGSFDASATNRFTLRAVTCPTRPISPGIVTSVFGPDDCPLPSGQVYEVFTIDHDGAGLAVASFSFGDNVCVIGLLPDGETIPREGCAQNLLELPLVQAGTYGLVVAAEDGSTRDPYSFLYRRCPATAIGYADRRAGTLTSLSCLAADGVRADWYYFSASENLVQFNDGFSGIVESTFRPGGLLTDADGGVAFERTFGSEPSSMLRMPNGQRGALLRVRGVNGNGPYTIAIDAAIRRQ